MLPWNLDALGGVNQVVLNLYRQFERCGILQPHVLISDWFAQDPVEEVHESGAKVTRVRVRPPFGEGWLLYELARYALSLPMEMRKLAAVVRRHNVRIVNCHYIGSASLAWLVAKTTGRFRGKVFLSLHGLDIRTIGKLQGARRTIWRYALEAADAIIAVSRELANETIEAFALSGRNVHVFDNGVDPEEIRRAAAGSPEPALPESFILSLGTYERKKGHDVLIRAFAHVAADYPLLSLIIAGRADDASEFDSLDALRRSLDVRDRIVLLRGLRHAEAMRVLARADVFVLASRQEPFGIAILEAGVLARPVVATAACGAAQRLQSGVELLVVPTDDHVALGEALRRVLGDGTAAKRLGGALHQRVAADFTWERIAAQYEALASASAA